MQQRREHLDEHPQTVDDALQLCRRDVELRHVAGKTWSALPLLGGETLRVWLYMDVAWHALYRCVHDLHLSDNLRRAIELTPLARMALRHRSERQIANEEMYERSGSLLLAPRAQVPLLLAPRSGSLVGGRGAA